LLKRSTAKENKIKKNILIGILVASVAGMFFFFPAANLFKRGSHIEKQVKDAFEAEPVRMKVDISKPGVYSCDLIQSFSRAHTEFFYIESSIKENEGFSNYNDETPSVLAGLKGKIEIKNEQGEIVEEIDISGNYRSSYTPQPVEEYPGWGIWSFKKGKDQLIFTVVEPLKTYEGIEQHLVARYGLCGCELLPAFFLKCIGGVLFLIGLIIAIIAFIKTSH